MLELALVSSSAPSMFRAKQDWKKIHSLLVGKVPQPREIKQETPEVIEKFITRIEKGFESLRQQLEKVKPEALIVVGDDGGMIFDHVQQPQFCMIVTDNFEGTTAFPGLGEELDSSNVTIKCHEKLGQFLLEELVVHKGFGISQSRVVYQVQHSKRGTTNAFVHPVLKLIPNLDIPIVPLYVNCYASPAPTGHRCFQLGQAIAKILEEWPGNVAIYGAGGLSCDPFGSRAGWIDKPLDQWVLSQISRGKADRLLKLFDVESDTNTGGTGETRSWIIASGAARGDRNKATIVDYFPSHTAATGIGFAYWQSK